jgi:hypothetical protein
MQRHHRNAATRIGLGTLIVSIVLSLMCAWVTPAGAAAVSAIAGADARSATPNQVVRALDLRCVPGAKRCVANGPHHLSEGGCGVLQRCLYFSRGEQMILMAGGSAAIIAAICTATIGLGCAIASSVVGAAFQWLSNRGSICPASKPRLKMRYFPSPAAYGCVD